MLLLVVAIPARDYDFMVNGLCYDYNDDGTSVMVTFQNYPYVGTPSYSNLSGSLTIPSSVTYSGKTYSVTSINGWAFQYCSGLTSVNIGNSVIEIGPRAFYYCSGITSVTIGKAVASFGNDVFLECPNITTVNWNAINCANSPFGYGFNNINTFNIGNTVTIIPSGLCSRLTGLTSVTIPNSVTSIGSNAFYGCTGLTSMNIPNSVTSIGSAAFSGCSGLTSVTIPSSIIKIENRAFEGCSNLQVAVSKIVNPQNVTYTNTTNSNLIFSGVPATSTLYVPKGTIESYQLEQYNNKPNPWLAFSTVTEFVDGDVNLDGNITSADVTALYNYLLYGDYGDSNHIATSDTNGDGIITIADITTLYNRILGN